MLKFTSELIDDDGLGLLSSELIFSVYCEAASKRGSHSKDERLGEKIHCLYLIDES